MADSKIEWTDRVWNPTIGCTRVSDGCQHCYAEALAPRLAAMGQEVYEGLTRKHGDGSVNWTGEVRCLPERLAIPLGWKKPQRIFVNSMSDLFHESVPDEFIARVFAVMAVATQHTFQILTKRPQRMYEWFTKTHGLESAEIYVAGEAERANPRLAIWDARGQDRWRYAMAASTAVESANFKLRRPFPGWPLPNVQIGVSTENQATADERIRSLLRTPAAVRFISAEPLLGPIDLSRYLFDPHSIGGPGSYTIEYTAELVAKYGTLDWVIAGGESGPHHRPVNLDWVRGIRDQCQAAGVAFLFKQVGGATPKAGGRELDGRTHDEYPERRAS